MSNQTSNTPERTSVLTTDIAIKRSESDGKDHFYKTKVNNETAYILAGTKHWTPEKKEKIQQQESVDLILNPNFEYNTHPVYELKLK
jgi:hypothetical protein